MLFSSPSPASLTQRCLCSQLGVGGTQPASFPLLAANKLGGEVRRQRRNTPTQTHTGLRAQGQPWARIPLLREREKGEGEGKEDTNMPLPARTALRQGHVCMWGGGGSDNHWAQKHSPHSPQAYTHLQADNRAPASLHARTLPVSHAQGRHRRYNLRTATHAVCTLGTRHPSSLARCKHTSSLAIVGSPTTLSNALLFRKALSSQERQPGTAMRVMFKLRGPTEVTRVLL